jgi:hypothetical protein
MCTPLVYRGLVYIVKFNGVLNVYDARSGEKKYQERLAGGTSAFTASPVASDGKVYLPNEDGRYSYHYNEELFIETMRTGRVRARQLSSLMPTDFYRHMSDEDLKATFAYLKTLAPVDHYVDNTMTPTDCPRCGLKHGGGERNKRPS